MQAVNVVGFCLLNPTPSGAQPSRGKGATGKSGAASSAPTWLFYLEGLAAARIASERGHAVRGDGRLRAAAQSRVTPVRLDPFRIYLHPKSRRIVWLEPSVFRERLAGAAPAVLQGNARI